MFPFYLKGPDFREPDAPIYYLLAANGLFLVKRNSIFMSRTRVQGLPWLDPQQEGYQMTCPRLPYWVLTRALAFFRAVYRRYGSEAILFLYFAPDRQEFLLTAPDQEVAPLFLFYQPEPAPTGYVKVGTLHSHGQLSGSHSSVDEEDEQYEDGLHISLGRILGDPSLDCELVIGSSRFELHPAEVLEPAPEGLSAESDFDFPAEWLDRVTGTAGHA